MFLFAEIESLTEEGAERVKRTVNEICADAQVSEEDQVSSWDHQGAVGQEREIFKAKNTEAS